MIPEITKRTQAEARNKAWASLTPVQQLEYLNKMGLIAAKQRAKIAKKMAK